MSDFPSSWIKVKLGDIFSFNYGKSLPERVRSGSGFPVYGSNGIIGHHDSALTNGQTVIIGRKGSVGEIHFSTTPCFPIDTTYYVDQFYGMPPRYWFYQLKTLHLSELNKATAIPGLNREDAYLQRVGLAPLQEQVRIASKLNGLLARVDECRDRLECISIIIKRFRQSILANAVSGKLTEDWRSENPNIESRTDFFIQLKEQFGGNSINGELDSQGNSGTESFWPENWLYVPVEAVGSVFLGRQRSPKNHNGPHMHPYVRAANITWNGWDLSDIKEMNFDPSDFERFKLQVGDVLVNEGSGSADEVGKPAIWNGMIENCCFQNTLICVRPYEDMSEYLYLVFLHAALSKAFVKETRGIGIHHLGKARFAAFKIPIPSLEEQKEIVHRANTLFLYADRLETYYQKALEKVERITNSLLNTAFRGELVLPDPQDESAVFLLERIRSETINLEFERKTKQIARRTAKKTPKVSMETPSDYLEALSSAFAESPGNNAHQLFNQAGFSSEEVVEFYEALRIAPEVRNAFEQSRQELPLQKQLSTTRSDNRIIGDEKFRLVNLWLEEFKNLVDYTVRFDESHSIDIMLGWNGTGKSNLFEALVVIFRDLHEWSIGKLWTKKSVKGFHLRYKISKQLVDITWYPQEMRSPLLRIGTIHKDKKEPENLTKTAKSKLPLPRFIFGYYSGPTNRLAEHFLPMNQNHYNSLRDAKSDDPETLAQLLENRRFFCAENRHAKYVLLAFFHKEDSAISQFLEKRLRIVGFESALFIIRKPRWAKQGAKAEDFWGARGVMRRVMERLRRFAIAPMVVEQNVREGYSLKSEEHYYFFLPNLQSLHALAAEYQDARTFFLALESIDFSELIYDLKIQVRVQATKTEQVAITFHELSEGEQQLLMVLGLMRFTKSHQSLVLLDEPDTHLNPHWSVDYLKLLSHVMSETSDESEEQQTSQILMSTHDPLVIASLLKEQIHLLKRDWQTNACVWEQPTVNPRGLGFTGILISEMFGMRSDLDEETLADLDNKVRLVAKEGSLTHEEVEELEEINERLEDAGFLKAFSDPYYAAFARAWGRRHSNLMAGVRFLSPEQQEEIDRISHELLEEAVAELEAEESR
jgi:restriction endonuclease S subunit/predicted ATPase